MTPSLAVLLGVLALAFASMAAFALVGKRDADAERKGAQLLMGAGNFLVHWFMWVLRPAERVFLALRIGPDAFNFAGLACGFASGLLIGSGRLELGGWAIALGGVCDIMDGRMARALSLDSSYGKFIDSTLDRFVEVFAFLGFVVFLEPFAWGPLLAAGAICGSLLVSYTRARGESVGVLCKEGLMQRAERLVLTCLACLADAPLSAALGRPRGSVVLFTVGLIALGTFLTAAHRTVWISARLREPNSAGR
jgi:CDP-diacylglycerol--glycerol-3-phosphate 3-phosphatidyltransferase